MAYLHRVADTTNDRARLEAPFLALVVFGVLGVAIPTYVLALENLGTTSRGQTAVVATLVIAAARYAWIVGSRDRRPFEMVLWLFTYFWMALAPLVQLRTNWPGTTPNVLASQVAPTSALVLVGVVCAIAGSSLGGRRGSRDGPSESGRQPVDGNRTIILSCAALTLAALYVVQVGVGSLFESRTQLGAASSAALGTGALSSLIRAGANMGLLVAFVALMHLRRQRREEHRSYPFLLSVTVLAVLLIIVNPLSSARFAFGTVALAVAATFGAYSTLRRFRVVAVSTLVGVVAVFPALDTFRRSRDATVTLTGPLESLTTGDFDAFAQTVNTVQYVETLGITWGQQIVGVIFFWVPRAIWPTKPLDTGVVVAEFKGYGFSNLSAPLWSEFFINGGWPFLIAGFFALGFALRRLDLKAERRLQLASIPTVLGCVLPFYMLIVLRGSLLQTTANLSVILVAAWFVRGKRGKPQT